MQFGSVQANAIVAMSITNNNLSIVIIIIKINPYFDLRFNKQHCLPSFWLPVLLFINQQQFRHCRMSCIHFASILQPAFLSTLTSKVYWTCLYDGCTKSKKNLSRSQLYHLCSRLNDEHKVMINCETLQIYCTECKKEILDTQEEQSKTKKGKFKTPRIVRELITGHTLTEDILFAGNAQYPPSFQKQRRGLCGLKANSLNSYLNATLQLLAAVPIIAEMSSLTDPLKVQSRFLRAFIRVIETIWSGKFRIASTQQVERQLLQEDSNFHSYRFKTPQHLLYFIVKKMIEEMHYSQVPCTSGQTGLPAFHQWSQTQQQRKYSFPRELLAGECVLECVCGACGKKQFAVNRFECLKVSYQRQGQGGQLNLCHLIEESFDWRNNHEQAIKRIEEGKLQCQSCKQRIKQYFAYVRLPNHLVLQLGDDLEGLDSSLPEQIDLLNFSEEHVKREKGGQAIYQYVGSVYRKDRRFCTHLRHPHNKKQFTICDELITEGPRSFENVKLAIYQRTSNPKNQPLLRNILSCLQVNINPIVPLPDYWSLYLKYNHNVQPLVNPYICTHGKLRHNFSASKIKQGPQRLPVQVYQYLVQTFGGRKIDVNVVQECQVCAQTQANIAQIRSSQREMASFADKLSHKKERVLINRSWLQSWKLFAYDNSKRGYRAFGHIRPGPIKNTTQNIEEDMKSGALKKISPQVWYFLHKFYGGGPLISKTEIHPNVVLTAAVNLRYENLESIITDLYGPPGSKQNETIKLRTSGQSIRDQQKEVEAQKDEEEQPRLQRQNKTQ